MFPEASSSASQPLMVNMLRDTWSVVEERKKEVPLAGVLALASMQDRPLDVVGALRQERGVTLLVQISRTAPDREELLENFDPLALAKRFESAGAAGLVVATNRAYYRGGVADLTLVSQTVEIPVIRQDLIFDEYQVVEARAAGADGVLLMSNIDAERLRNLVSITQRNRMTELVQVRTERELNLVLPLEPRCIVLTSRQPDSAEVDFALIKHLRRQIPPYMVVVSNLAGITRPEQVAQLADCGVEAVIVGHNLLGGIDPSQAIRALLHLVEKSA